MTESKRAEANETNDLDVVGWAELLTISEFGSDPLRAKIDTGAVRCSLNAPDLQIVEKEEKAFAEFTFTPETGEPKRVSAEIIRYREVKCSHGDSDKRPIINLTINLGTKSIAIEASLADRQRMLFPMLIGRAALAENFVVDSHRCYLQSHEHQLKPVSSGFEDPDQAEETEGN